MSNVAVAENTPVIDQGQDPITDALRSVRNARHFIATADPKDVQALLDAEKSGKKRKTIIQGAVARLHVEGVSPAPPKAPETPKVRKPRKPRKGSAASLEAALKTAKTVNAYLEDAGSAEIEALIQAEKAGKNRKGVMAAAEKALENAKKRERFGSILKTVSTATVFMSTASPDEIKDLVEAEKAGKNRKGILNLVPEALAVAKERERMHQALGTVADAKGYISQASAEQIRALLDMEKAGKNRKGLIAAAEAALTPKSASAKEAPVKKAPAKRTKTKTKNLKAKRFQSAMLLVLAEETGFDPSKTVSFTEILPKILDRVSLTDEERKIVEAAWPSSPYNSAEAYIRRRIEWAHRNLRGGRYGGKVALTRTGEKSGEWGLTEEGIRAAHLLSAGTAESVKVARKEILKSEKVEPETLDAGALIEEDEEPLPPEPGDEKVTILEEAVEPAVKAEEPVKAEKPAAEKVITEKGSPKTKNSVKAEAPKPTPKKKRSRAARSISAAQVTAG